MDRQILALEQIGKRRYERAQTAVFVALNEKEAAEKALATDKANHEDYKQKLPGLVQELYTKIMGKLTDSDTISKLLQDELKLTHGLVELKEKMDKAATTLELSEAALVKAYGALALQERKKTALAELRKEYKKKEKEGEDRKLAKVMDEFANYRFIAN